MKQGWVMFTSSIWSILFCNHLSLILLVFWWKRKKVKLCTALLSVLDYMLQIGKLWLLSADVWRKRSGGMDSDDNVAWSRAPSSHIEKRCAESRSMFEVIGMCIFPFWLSVLFSPVSPSYLSRLPQHGWQTSPPVVTTCICVCSCFSVRFHKLTFHLHITQEKKTKTKPKTLLSGSFYWPFKVRIC